MIHFRTQNKSEIRRCEKTNDAQRVIQGEPQNWHLYTALPMTVSTSPPTSSNPSSPPPRSRKSSQSGPPSSPRFVIPRLLGNRGFDDWWWIIRPLKERMLRSFSWTSDLEVVLLLPQLLEEPLPSPVELTLSQPLRRSQRVSYPPLQSAHCAHHRVCLPL